MQVEYPIKVQAIRSQGRPVRLFVAVPLALAAAIGLEPGEEVQWELVNREKLYLVRPPPATQAPRASGEKRRGVFQRNPFRDVTLMPIRPFGPFVARPWIQMGD